MRLLQDNLHLLKGLKNYFVNYHWHKLENFVSAQRHQFRWLLPPPHSHSVVAPHVLHLSIHSRKNIKKFYFKKIRKINEQEKESQQNIFPMRHHRTVR